MANYDRGPGSYGFMNPAPMQEPVQPIYDRGPVMIPQPIYDRGPTMAPEPPTPAPTVGLSPVELPINNKLPVAQSQTETPTTWEKYDANISEQQWLANQTRRYYPNRWKSSSLYPRPTGWPQQPWNISMFMPTPPPGVPTLTHRIPQQPSTQRNIQTKPQIADSFGGPSEKYKELRDKMRNFQWGGGPDMRYSEWP